MLNALDIRAAQNADVGDLLEALPPLARLARYGDVRGREGLGDEAAAVTFRTLHTRAAVGLPVAAIGLAEDAADTLRQQVHNGDAAVRLLDQADVLAEWQDALVRLANRDDVHPLLGGDAVRRLRDAGRFDGQETEQRMGLALVDDWVAQLDPEAFQEVLPLLRRVFSRFAKPERRAIGESVHGVGGQGREVAAVLHEGRGMLVVPLVARLLGIASNSQGGEA